MVNIKKSQTNKMLPTGDNKELECVQRSPLHVTPMKSSSLTGRKEGLLITEEKYRVGCLSLKKMKPHSPSSNDREATT